MMLPAVVLHADWSTAANKRWLAEARLGADGRYTASAPRLVSEHSFNLSDLIPNLQRELGNEGCAIIGFDFPIGLPKAYAEKAQVTDFKKFLVGLGKGDWADFYNVCSSRNDINIHRPFYPFCCPKKGDAIRDHLVERLGIAFDDLYRRCERAHTDREAASPLFWTLGAKQVGKAAIVGWRDVITPALNNKQWGRRVRLWPFDGPLKKLLKPRQVVVLETYPAEYYTSFFGDGWKGKGKLQARQAVASKLPACSDKARITCETSLAQAMRDGFTSDDAFDASSDWWESQTYCTVGGLLPHRQPQLTSKAGYSVRRLFDFRFVRLSCRHGSAAGDRRTAHRGLHHRCD